MDTLCREQTDLLGHGAVPPVWHRVRVRSLLVLVSTVLFATAIVRTMWAGPTRAAQGDFLWHAEAARQLSEHGRLSAPHFLFHLLAAGVHLFLPWLGWKGASSVVLLGANAALTLLLFEVLCRAARVSAEEYNWPVFWTALALTFIGPVNLLTAHRHNYYFGYIAMTVYHNPTAILLRPLGLGLWLLAQRAFTLGRTSGAAILGGACLCLATTLAKPSLTICLVPAAACLWAYCVTHSKPADERFLWLGLFLPAGLALAWQYVWTYASGTETSQNKIILAPLGVMSCLSDELAAKFLCSVLFPLVFALLFFRRALGSPGTLLAAATFAFGAACTYLLAEYHPDPVRSRFGDGNFLWSGQIGLYLLMVAVTCEWVLSRSHRNQPGPSSRALQAAFGLHVLGGALFFLFPYRW